ncbi:two-partner secretion domain-containing protein [Paraburkholderia kururiensis]|uniref:two-partner secretion domain-containing protein n=1 Tax=Paraburkholderia kururiensis TaxID=984307 RepID=UPI0018F5600A|nr:filamentous hemagglutinin N-terminal domain-containing protein [Paraburkholderia kururiensis]
MNHAYRLVWNQTVNAWVAVPETARAHGKGSKLKAAAVVVASIAALNAYALPTGGQVSAGSGTISQGGSTMTVSQGSQSLAINWNSFNVAAPETVNFVQPNKSSIALNRVVGSDPSAIYGKLNANGQVFLVNPNGILFGKGAQVNVGGLVASTQNITDADFMNRNFRFTGTAGSVVNQGAINGDYVALLGGQVSNQGTIAARLGTVALAAGSDITLDFAGDGLIGIKVNQGTLDALAENRQLIKADGGTVVLTAKAADSLISAVVNNSGVIEAARVDNQGGTIRLLGDSTTGVAQNSGTLTGGQVDVSARSVLQSGTISTDAANLAATYALVQTAGGRVSGKSVRVDGGEHTFISGALTGTTDLTVAGQTVTLAGAQLATGNNGSLRVGGGAHGQDADIANAQSVAVNGATTLTGGDGAHVTVWSDGTTNYFGQTRAGNDSFVEVSSKRTLNLAGTVSVGAGGQILYDPANIVIDASPTSSMFYLDLADPAAAAGNQHGSGGVTELSNGNIVVSSPQDNFGASTAGAVYLYDGRTGALISTLAGSHAGDQVGNNGVKALTGGNYVVDSSSWNGRMGAVTWGSGTSGVTGTVSSANSLVGSVANDSVGAYGITALANGNYVVDSGGWSAGTGAVTWGSGTSGVVGVVSSTNSLVGSSNRDNVGTGGVTALTNGNYVVDSTGWSAGTGAVTWGSGTSGVTGTISSANSLVGSATGDSVGVYGITALANGNYVVDSPYWNRGRGAVTWGSGTSGITGTVSGANSLVGSSTGDSVGSDRIDLLTNGNYVVGSSNWSRSKGAVTWGSGTGGVVGAVSSANSLVGSTSGDYVGNGGITALTNGNYVVDSSGWSTNTGAVTWGSGTGGVAGIVSSANSLVGSAAGDYVGTNGGVTALTNGNYVVSSGSWNGGTGAATWGSGTSGVVGIVSSANSLVGSSNRDNVGNGGATALANGNYVVISGNWHGSTGAATWGSGTSGVVGVVSSANSLVGSNAGDFVGNNGVTALANGNYVVDSANWAGGVGAATWGSGTGGVVGVVSSANSLVGSNVDDSVGHDGITPLANGNYVVSSSAWNGGMGAVTWGSGTSGVVGVVSSANSLVGSVANDSVGVGGITPLINGNYVVSSANWNGGMGAVTWGSGTSGVVGVVSSANSLVGSTAGDYVGNGGITALTNGNYVVNSSSWNAGRGAVTWGSRTSGVTGTLSSANSLVGSSAGDYVGSPTGDGSYGVNPLANGNYVVLSQGQNGMVWLVADPSNLGNLASGSMADVTVSPAQLAVAAGAGSSITLQATNDITVNSAVSVAGRLSLVAGNVLTLNAGLTSSSSGDALSLAGTSFVNNAGTNALSTPNGRWLVYSASPSSNAVGGLISGGADVYGATMASNAPSTIAAGNHFVYASAAPVTIPPTVIPTSPSRPSGTSGATDTPGTPASSNAPAGESAAGYRGVLAWAQAIVSSTSPMYGATSDMQSSAAANGTRGDQFAGTDGPFNTASNLVPATVPGLEVIDTGIRLPDGLRNGN